MSALLKRLGPADRSSAMANDVDATGTSPRVWCTAHHGPNVKAARQPLLLRWLLGVTIMEPTRIEDGLNRMVKMVRDTGEAHSLEEARDLFARYRLRWQRLPAFKKLARTLYDHFDGILNCRHNGPLRRRRSDQRQPSSRHPQGPQLSRPRVPDPSGFRILEQSGLG